MTTHHDMLAALRAQLASFTPTALDRDVGTVLSVADGVAMVSGLQGVMSSELVMMGETPGVALNLEDATVGVIILGETSTVKAGDMVARSNHVLSLSVGDAFTGRVVDPLGKPLDGGAPIVGDRDMPLERVAPGVMTREPVSVPLHTGVKVVDALIPIGRGQRELIIGDRQTGKTALAIDTILHQKESGVRCVYVAIGQKESKIAQIVARLRAGGAMAYTTVVLAGASESAALSYLAPYAGAAIAEYFMARGEDVLIVYDDLTKHAVAYREISLLLGRPPGREAYPGDVFYLHSRLLERAARCNKENGGGSITALPIIETQAGDVAAYIPTNVISITDGQIYLESDLFYRGQRPAVNIGLSVSRVGSAAQTKAMKSVAKSLKVDLAQYRELEAFAQFASDLDDATKRQLDRGRRAMEVMKQGQYAPLTFADIVAVVFALNAGTLDRVPVEEIRSVEEEFLQMFRSEGSAVRDEILAQKAVSPEATAQLEKLWSALLEGRYATVA